MKKIYIVKVKNDITYWVYEQTDNGTRALGAFETNEQAEEFIKMKEYKDNFMEDIRNGLIKKEDLPF